MVHRILTGRPPTAEGLARIALSEAVSLSWLVAGIGPPYLVQSLGDKGGALAVRSAMLRPAARLLWLRSVGRAGVVALLWMDAAPTDYGPEPFWFPAAELLRIEGPLTRLAMAESAPILGLEVGDEAMERLDAGQVGAAALREGPPEGLGWVEGAQPLGTREMREEALAYGAQPPDEVALLRAFRAMGADRRAALLGLLADPPDGPPDPRVVSIDRIQMRRPR